MGRIAPRPAASAIRAARDRAAPQTTLAATQAVWAEVVGPALAAAAEPASERGGTVTVRCESAVWAQELEMMGEQVLARLRQRLGEQTPVSLRFATHPGWPAKQ
jgi:predicted nucleic acid-binding Zn ribbon protein